MPELTTTQIQSAISTVEKVNHVKLDRLNQSIIEDPQSIIETFCALVGLESMDDRFKYILRNRPQLESEASYLLETSVLLG